MESFAYTTSLTPAREPWLRAILATYVPGAAVPASSDSLRLQFDPGPQDPRLPRLRKRFVKRAAPVSVRLQETLRAWLPLLWFQDPARYREPQLAAQMIVYGLCRPFTPRNQDSYSFHLLDPATWPAILDSARRRIKAFHPCLIPALQDAAVPPDSPLWRPAKIIRQADRDHHLLEGLIERERALIELFVRRLSGDLEPSRLARFAALASRPLRRSFADMDATRLLPLLEIEARDALALHLTGEPARETDAILNPGGEFTRISPRAATNIPCEPESLRSC